MLYDPDRDAPPKGGPLAQRIADEAASLRYTEDLANGAALRMLEEWRVLHR